MAKRTATTSTTSADPSSPMVKKQTIHSTYDTAAIETWVKCGECANTLGLTKEAIKSFENAVHRDPSNITALCGLSLSLRVNDITQNETFGSQSAIEKINASIDMFPHLLQHSNIFKELAECYLLIGLNDQAHQAIQSAIQLSPNDASLWLLSAQTLIRAGARSHAANSLSHCLSLLPPNESSYSSQDIETARAAHAELAAIAAADGNIETSIAELTSTLSLPPPPLSRIDEHIALWCALSTAKERANDITGAIKACEDAQLAVGNSPRILMTNAYLLLLLNPKENADAAITILNKIVNLPADESLINEGTDFLPWYLLGRAHSFVERPRLAYDSYQVALKCASNSPITWLAVGKLYLELKQLPDALAAYSQALKLQLDDGSQGTATAWDGLSCVYERCDDHLMDASDACNRAALCYKAIGDLKNYNYFESRADQFARAAKNSAPVPDLRQPPDVPSFLLRDLVALAPNERIAFTQTQRQSPPQQHAQQHAQPPAQPPAPHPQQQPPQQQPPVKQEQNPSVHQTPSSQQQQQPQYGPPPPQSQYGPPPPSQQQYQQTPSYHPSPYQQPTVPQHLQPTPQPPHQQPQPPQSQQQTPSQPPYRSVAQPQYYYPPPPPPPPQLSQPQQYYYAAPPPPQSQQQNQQQNQPQPQPQQQQQQHQQPQHQQHSPPQLSRPQMLHAGAGAGGPPPPAPPPGTQYPMVPPNPGSLPPPQGTRGTLGGVPGYGPGQAPPPPPNYGSYLPVPGINNGGGGSNGGGGAGGSSNGSGQQQQQQQQQPYGSPTWRR
ncbi:hypothetical protein KGF57_000030 [Candida theae]|uniref:Uncharacterized protein n=1 Tax=Candida theae TaxID=1198502 RepID=A0AAD5BJP6_9ASCO|nr:uncharacterized protein KGF57_000030 [Candida theae]KAI5968915.1 hypothetical protein KGF57_000030 [Candida theae]